MFRGELAVEIPSIMTLTFTLVLPSFSASCSVVNKLAAKLAGIEDSEEERKYFSSFPPVTVELKDHRIITGSGSSTSENAIMTMGGAMAVDPESVGREEQRASSLGGMAWPGGGGGPGGRGVTTRLPGPMPIREIPSLTSLGLGSCPVMVLGMDVLCRSRAVFCFGSNTIYVQTPPVC